MRELNTYDTVAQSEALINELKGNLFEFLVGKQLSQMAGSEGEFMRSIPTDFQERLRGYEGWLRQNSEGLLENLPQLAEDTAKYLVEKLPKRIEAVRVVGKLAGGSHDHRVKEADLLIKSGEDILPISLKLCRENSYVNTKSAGVRSFFTKYFANAFPEISKKQKMLNSILDNEFENLSRTLHKMGGLEELPQFGHVWTGAGFSELPGQLDNEMREVLKSHYYKMISLFYKVWEELLLKNEGYFYKCMMPLLGFGNESIQQFSCFYRGDYELSYNSCSFAKPLMRSLPNADLIPPKDGLSSFEMVMKDCTFQVRLKPMNKFTVSGLKVNCSLKQHKSC